MISAAVGLSGCSFLMPAADPPPAGTVQQMCDPDKGWRPIRPSRQDKLTDGTVKMIAGNNASQETWCGKSGSPAKAKAAKAVS